MILVSLGTHPSPMPRLIDALRDLLNEGVLSEEVVIQSAAPTARSEGFQVVSVVPHEELVQLMRNARVVICHGGPATIMEVLAVGRAPIVVARDPRYGEHVDDHQIRFVRWLSTRRPILAVWSMEDLPAALLRGEMAAVADNSTARTAVVSRLVSIVEQALRH